MSDDKVVVPSFTLTKHEAFTVGFYMSDRAADIDLSANRWISKIGEKGDAFELGLREDAETFRRIARLIAKAEKPVEG